MERTLSLTIAHSRKAMKYGKTRIAYYLFRVRPHGHLSALCHHVRAITLMVGSSFLMLLFEDGMALRWGVVSVV